MKGQLEASGSTAHLLLLNQLPSKNAAEDEDNAQRQTIILFDVYALLCYCLGRRGLKETSVAASSNVFGVEAQGSGVHDLSAVGCVIGALVPAALPHCFACNIASARRSRLASDHRHQNLYIHPASIRAQGWLL
jgi:hypothetical protein